MDFIPNMEKFEAALQEAVMLFDVSMRKRYKPYYKDNHGVAAMGNTNEPSFSDKINRRLHKIVRDALQQQANTVYFDAVNNVSADPEGHPRIKNRWLNTYRIHIGKTISMWAWYCINMRMPIPIDNKITRYVANIRDCKSAYDADNHDI